MFDDVFIWSSKMLRKFPQKQRNSVDLATVPLRLLHLREEEQQIKAFSAAVDSYLIFFFLKKRKC